MTTAGGRKDSPSIPHFPLLILCNMSIQPFLISRVHPHGPPVVTAINQFWSIGKIPHDQSVIIDYCWGGSVCVCATVSDTCAAIMMTKLYTTASKQCPMSFSDVFDYAMIGNTH